MRSSAVTMQARATRSLGLYVLAVVSGCWIVAGTEDFEPESATTAANGGSTSQGAGASTAGRRRHFEPGSGRRRRAVAVHAGPDGQRHPRLLHVLRKQA